MTPSGWMEVANPEHPFTAMLISRSRGTCIIANVMRGVLIMRSNALPDLIEFLPCYQTKSVDELGWFTEEVEITWVNHLQTERSEYIRSCHEGSHTHISCILRIGVIDWLTKPVVFEEPKPWKLQNQNITFLRVIDWPTSTNRLQAIFSKSSSLYLLNEYLLCKKATHSMLSGTRCRLQEMI